MSTISLFRTFSISAPVVPKVPVLKPEVEDDDAHCCRRQNQANNLKERRPRGFGHEVEHTEAYGQNGSVFQEGDAEGNGVDSADGFFVLLHSNHLRLLRQQPLNQVDVLYALVVSIHDDIVQSKKDFRVVIINFL